MDEISPSANLLIPVGELLAGESGKSKVCYLQQESIVLTEDTKAEVSGKITLTKTAKDAVIARGQFRAEITAPCARCLDEAHLSLNLNLEQEYEVSPPADEEVLPIFEGKVNLEKAIYRETLVNLPVKILCQENCRGICAGCGVNLNREKCRCKKSAGENRE